MILSQQLVNDNGISYVALGFFTALLGLVGIIVKEVYATKRAQLEAKEAAQVAAEKAEEATANTKNVSNGFAGKVLGELSEVRMGLEKLNTALREHIEWHLKEGDKK